MMVTQWARQHWHRVSAVLIFLLLVLALLVVFAAPQYWQQQAADKLPVNTALGGDFILPATQAGGVLDTRELRGKILLLNFGFTSCPDVCPLVLARLAQVRRELGPAAQDVQILFVSFDPARDSLAHLRAYVQHFDAGIVAATGSEAEIAALAARYGVVYLRENMDSAVGYGFAHSDYIYLLDTQGRLRKLYAHDAAVADIVNDVRLLQKAGGA